MEISPENPEVTETELLQAGYRFAFALTHHREEAEDLVQETWLNLCRRYGRVETRAILFTAVRNLFIDHCRRKKLVYFESMDQPDVPEVPDVAVEEPCVKGELAVLLGSLRPAEREVIFLHYYHGHTAEEIAGMTEQSRGTVLSLMHRSMAKLRKVAEAREGEFARNHLLVLFVLLNAMVR